MSRLQRLLVAIASVAVLGVFIFPLWRIDLEAPQYPEGIGMLIHVDGVGGVKEHDLDNINGLNHYIGMKKIDPDAIPELAYMPWIAGGIVVTGLGVAALGRRRVYVPWALTVLGVFAYGMYDFWRWEYDYGHDLDLEHAAIKVPGMAYQPPLIGSKQILNFVAHSWPDVGGWLLIGAGTVFGLVLACTLLGERSPIAACRPSAARRAARAPLPAPHAGARAA
jgi:hypothetical protein